MIPLSVAEVAQAVDGRVLRDLDGTVDEVTTDSRDVPAGAIFFALRGEHHDGHDHIDEALEAGAVGFVAERDPGDGPGILVEDTWTALGSLAAEVRRRVDPTVVALTGSVGKTTTKDLTAAALRASLTTVAAHGSYNNEVGVPLTCLQLQAETEAAVVEIGSRGVGHIRALIPIVEPDISIVTVVAAAHLEMFGDLDTVARAKREIVEALRPEGTAVLNADDPRVAGMADHTSAEIVTYGVGEGSNAEVVATDVRLDRLARPTFVVNSPWGTAEVRLPLAGAHHVGNALAALAAAVAAGVDLDLAAAALADAPVSRWRSAVSEAGGVVVINDAYNANPRSVAAALETLARVERPPEGETWAVLGVMAELGSDAEQAHVEVGEACDGVADHLVVVGDEAAAIAEGAAGVGDVRRVADADEALEIVRGGVARGDVVLVKGSRVAGLERVAEGVVEHRREESER